MSQEAATLASQTAPDRKVEAPAWFRWLVVAALLAMFLGAMAYAIASNVAEEDSGERYYEAREVGQTLAPLHEAKGDPEPDEWLAYQPEMGQTLDQYVHEKPIVPTPKRRTMLVLPLGEFTPEQRRIVDLSTEFMGLYFGLPAEQLDPVPDSVVPEFARREWGYPQFSAPFIREKVLKPRLPDDAMFLIAFTATDLWPGKDGWNFVFGQASLVDRVGVWSIKRFGDPSASQAEFQVALLHSLKTATHESGHMFGMRHCVEYKCAMGGSISLEEASERPLELCPECLGKVLWATGVDAKERFRALADFCGRNGLAEEQALYEKSLEALESDD